VNKETGSRYRGAMKNGVFDGIGEYTDSKGDVYIGDFVAGKQTGQCEIKYANE
jgi:hypothetical protein